MYKQQTKHRIIVYSHTGKPQEDPISLKFWCTLNLNVVHIVPVWALINWINKI